MRTLRQQRPRVGDARRFSEPISVVRARAAETRVVGRQAQREAVVSSPRKWRVGEESDDPGRGIVVPEMATAAWPQRFATNASLSGAWRQRSPRSRRFAPLSDRRSWSPRSCIRSVLCASSAGCLESSAMPCCWVLKGFWQSIARASAGAQRNAPTARIDRQRIFDVARDAARVSAASHAVRSLLLAQARPDGGAERRGRPGT